MTFITDLDDLIRDRHGDVKKLREIRDTIRHDNFITTSDKSYVESLITTHLKNQPLEKLPYHKQSNVKSELQQKPTTGSSHPKNNSASSFSSAKKLSVFAGIAAAIAVIVIVGFTMDYNVNSTPSEPLMINVDQTVYKKADIISISGDTVSNAKSVKLSIQDTNGVKIWGENIKPRNDGKFSTLVIAGGGGWENDGVYILKATHSDLASEIEFKFFT